MRRWRGQRHNKKLRRRIAKIERDIEAHSATLQRQQWGQICNTLNGQMGCKKTCHYLRHLIDPSSSKSAVRKQFELIIHQYPGTDEELLDELANHYMNTSHHNQKSSSNNATTTVPEATGSHWTPVSSLSAHREGHYGRKPVRAHRTTASTNQDYGVIASPRRSCTMPADAELQGRTEGGSTTPLTHRVSSFQGMGVIEVQGETIAPEEVTKEAGWLTSHRNRSRRAIAQELQIGDTHYEATAYAAPPADTYKGVIHNIPGYDTAKDITKSLIYKKNPTILQARRMSNTSSVIIIFEGPKVPFYVYYRGAEYRCYLHQKKVEVCGACGRIGHRTDVCPTPDKKQCKNCGAQNPAENHNCNAKCALCGKGHPTGGKSCQRRLQTPFLIKQRQWEKQRQQQSLDNHSGGGRNPSLPRQDGKQTTAAQRQSRSNSRDTAADRKAPRSRCRSGH
ncbi:hypothetical protein HPB49_026240 [Dermacentor silvarum]|nr:hypothetical protein HPB49_026240 [Dermacentor silvarum]